MGLDYCTLASMPTSVARRILGEMLEGDELDEARVRELVSVDGESLYIDFKDGAELNDLTKARRTLRRYVSGFANADGGLLIVGVSDGGGVAANRTFTPTLRPGGRPLTEWARTVLADMGGSLTPPPRIQVVDVAGVEVLVVGVARVPALVACLEQGELRYYLRIGDSTPSIPPYLISDLVLGRRVHPQLLATIRAHGSGAVNGPEAYFAFDVENESMVPAADVIVGLVSWGLGTSSPTRGRLASPAVRNFVDAVPFECPGAPLVLVHVTSRANAIALALPAFENAPVTGIGPLTVPREGTHDVRSALYVLASGHPPEWYQLDWTLPPPPSTAIGMTVVRTPVERPIVSWRRR
jgi:hypothetical protein